ncbi:dihydroorotase family protein [Klugiella sp. YN-L-19]|uniref:Dihydroorotase family protein n=1 Tax=Ruicaihuangia caeni TaxID=3042517 RepID=A0AAW6TAQ7_9MICO|nr:dihydroorotase family protein [Klugiella sp. YN-L-19]
MIRNARVDGSRDGEQLIDIGIAEGKIVAMTEPGMLSAPEELDAAGRTVVPGAVDVHVHLGNGPQTVIEDLVTETRMAASGGVTTICPYIISAGGYDDIMGQLADAVSERSAVDVFPQLGIVSPDQISEVPRLHREFGVRAFKCFMGYKGAEASPSGIRGIDDASIVVLMSEVAKIPGGRLAVHAENMEIIEAARARVQHDEPDGSLAAWTRARPSLAETEAVQRVLQFARETGCPVTIPHMSVGQDIALLREHAVGVDAVFETCPHFLLFTCESPIGVWGKANPPLRGALDQAALWAALKGGALDVLGSDHCPFDAKTKQADRTIWEARPGIPNGSAVILPMMFDRRAGDPEISAAMITELTSQNAAARFALAGKGTIALGADADLAIIDATPAVFDSAELGGVATHSPYDGRTFGHRVWATIARGDMVFLEGERRNPTRPARVLT